ncbi:ABC transporter ATP-binding protein [Kocuria coralli]|uniref:ABC transporter ATP-binding protein n=1 Tax=Kocuria coralli TaxID=1461025 RepID=A0A5J5KZ93_9MICC|nr:ABC transporter ATP-binding protein [Kocuria coralli]KAA9394660.1 ABC transporter ATP-binding protein [Kocuria coralli]
MKLELREITKKFGSFAANRNVSLTVEPGEIHCLLGENGAGKSTLMNVLYGLYQPTSGEILVDDLAVEFNGPSDALDCGIGMVHQHFMLVPVFTVAENVALGSESLKGASLDLETTRSKIREISDQYGFAVDPDAVVEDLPVGVQQRVEIIKALVRDAELLILDEPTAVLTPKETDELLAIMRQLKENGTSIVFISHKLREVREVSDVITVIRRGEVVGSVSPQATPGELAAMMVGREVSLSVTKAEAQAGEEALVVSDLTVVGSNGVTLLENLNLSVAKGEILAVAGVQGNGQVEFAEALLGLRKASGSIRLEGKELVGRSVRQVLEAGVGFVPEDRSTDGLVGPFSVAENLVLDLYKDPRFRSGLSLRKRAIAANAEERIAEFDIRTGSANAHAATLSGGNQQKIVIARELSRPLKLFLASQPTRGVDVGSVEFIHERIVAERDSGVPVIIVSTELDEVYALADRIAVFFHGRLMGIVGPDTPREILGQMMAGATEDEVRATPPPDGDGGPQPPAASQRDAGPSGDDPIHHDGRAVPNAPWEEQA